MKLRSRPGALPALFLAACSASAPGPASPAADAGSPPSADALPSTWPMASPEQLALRLTRFLWDGDETDPSVRQALAVTPLTPTAVGEVAASMLNDARARAGVRAFYKWW